MIQSDTQKEYKEICDKLRPFMLEQVEQVLDETGLQNKLFSLLCGHISKTRFYTNDYENLGFRDFTKEIISPDSSRDKYPNGCVVIRTDDGFWIDAVLPYELYFNRDIRDICESIWPELKKEKVTYHKDEIGFF